MGTWGRSPCLPPPWGCVPEDRAQEPLGDTFLPRGSQLARMPTGRAWQVCRNDAQTPSWPGMSLPPEPPAGRAYSKLEGGGWLPAGLIGVSVP